ncbi:hypothetical protein [Caldovatus aquaticus]|uniref:Lipoprotein n=1 Tax=Caldovatus aquaticus TaxID=2865671 RepID=A0ABS7F2M0_9PROT|nr:hypothetical protein [Caldovatus aquaticus]MBW8269753.1 hypothetical protein [Caldovatus aquaticus]
MRTSPERTRRPATGPAAATLLPLLLATACTGAPETQPDPGPGDGQLATAAMALRLPAELLGLRRGAVESVVLPRLGSGLAVRYAPDEGGALASVVLVARDEAADVAGEDPRAPAATAEFERMLAAEMIGLPDAGPPRRPAEPEEQFLVALRGQPLVRCATLTEAAADGRRLNGLRCLGVARTRFVRVFLTATPGAMELRRAAGFAALVTALLQDGAAQAGGGPPEEGGAAPPAPRLPFGLEERPPPLPGGRGPVYRL